MQETLHFWGITDSMMKTKVAFLWDESFLWGLMAYEALKKSCLPFDLIRTEDIKNKSIHDYKMLFVPGGWASNKLNALGDEGVNEIRSFVSNGGSYLGFCGGAGLATLDGIGLLNIKRRATKDRVPSFSGRIRVKIIEHPIWMDLYKNEYDDAPFSYEHIFHAWWPSQFIVLDKKIRILATYGEAMPDAFSSDLCVGDVMCNNGNWGQLESIYKINLDPFRLFNEPAVVEDYYGKGRVILSLIHFDTPDDMAGQAVLRSLWEYLLDGNLEYALHRSPDLASIDTHHRVQSASAISELEDTVRDLIDLGVRNFLWFQRNPMLYQWRRGIRGLEYCTLYILIKKIAEMLSSYPVFSKGTIYSSDEILDQQLLKIREILLPFCKKAKELLIMERFALQEGHITYEKCDDSRIQSIRNELFSNSKSYGGIFKRLINRIDKLLYDLIKQRH